MGSVIGEILPLALAIAMSPIPIIAVTLMLLAHNARAKSVWFMAGWTLGIAFAVAAAILISSILPDRDPDESAPVAATIKLAIGALLVFTAIKGWVNRPDTDEDPELPGWMSTLSSLSLAKSFSVGFMLAGLNPKNVMFAAAAGVPIGASGLSSSSMAVTTGMFIVLASSSVIVPVLAYLVSGERMDPGLQRTERWLTRNSTIIMGLVKLLIGVMVIGNGIDSL